MFGRVILLAATLMLSGPMLTSARATVLVGDQYVDYTDLLIVTNVGGDRLLRRMRLAANTFCSPTQDAAQRICRSEAMTRAVASVRSSALTARHQWETPAGSTAA
jgi:UrcA family protein